MKTIILTITTFLLVLPCFAEVKSTTADRDTKNISKNTIQNAAISSNKNVVKTDNTSIQQIENYLNSLTTFEADFTQFVPGMDKSMGKFYLQRPRQFLWQYKTPKKHKLVSNGKRLFFHDGDNSQLTQLPLNSGLAAIFTRKEFNLVDDDIIIKSLRRKNGFIELGLSLDDENNNDSDNANATVILVFSTQPMQLVQLANVDPLGSKIVVNFDNIQQGNPIASDIFEVEMPFGDF